VIGAETVAFLEGGCALIVGTVAADGEPRANRGWGITVLSGSDADDVADVAIRLVLDAGDPVLRQNLETTGRIAVTAGNVQTLHSTQLKGRAVAIGAATDADRARATRYIETFADDVVAVDRTPRELIVRMAPSEFFAIEIAVSELYDQTPGPGAGARLEQVAG
jgi:hypothetical protein